MHRGRASWWVAPPWWGGRNRKDSMGPEVSWPGGPGSLLSGAAQEDGATCASCNDRPLSSDPMPPRASGGAWLTIVFCSVVPSQGHTVAQQGG